jgi:hypothetical protein
MTLKEVKTFIESLGIPCAYYQFTEDTAVPPPFICWYYPDGDDFIADNENYQKINSLTIELYTDFRDFELEANVESALIEAGFVYSWDETFIESEKMHLTTYYTEVIING